MLVHSRLLWKIIRYALSTVEFRAVVRYKITQQTVFEYAFRRVQVTGTLPVVAGPVTVACSVGVTERFTIVTVPVFFAR